MKHIKKIIIPAAFFLLFSVFIDTDASDNLENAEITEIHYRSSIDSYNPFLHIWFFLFESDNREFFWREKEGLDKNGHYYEVLFSNKTRLVAKFFSRNSEVGGIVDFGGEELSGKLDAGQAKTWFDMRKFSRSAKPGDVYRANYKTSKNDYSIFIEAKNFSDKSLYFEGKVLKKSKQFVDFKFWIASEGKLKGQVIKCIFKKTFWPSVVIEIM